MIKSKNLFGIIAAAVLMAACQPEGPPVLSLEEAKQITATFEGSSFVPPPRTIGDITAILDEQRVADPEEVARRIATADKVPPENPDPQVQAAFYMHRGRSAKEIGRMEQRLQDLRTALSYAEKDSKWTPKCCAGWPG